MDTNSLSSGGLGEALTVDDAWETIIPVKDQVLLRPEPPKKETKSGIVLPGSMKIPSFRGRVLAMSHLLLMQYESLNVPKEHRIRVNDKVIFHWGGAMPQDIEAELPNVLIPCTNIMAVVRTDNAKRRTKQSAGVA